MTTTAKKGAVPGKSREISSARGTEQDKIQDVFVAGGGYVGLCVSVSGFRKIDRISSN